LTKATAEAETTLQRALREFASVVGEDNIVRIGEPAVERLRDKFHPFYGTSREPVPAGGVLPRTVRDVQAVLKIANKYHVPLWTISRGRNYGYGGPAGIGSGFVTLDLHRMDRIIEINEEHAYAVVEPGVSPEMLLAEIERRGLRLWVDSASNPYGSLLGNALERGVGHGVWADRFEAVCGMEVVLPDGEVIRTGNGAMTNSTTWHQYKYGYGPHVDGLFTQSNYGIVTKIGLWLIPEPPSFRHAEVYIGDLGEAEDFIDILRDLRRSGVIDNGLNGGVNFGGHIEGAKTVYGGRLPHPGERPGMRARLGYLGLEKVVDAKWEHTCEMLNRIDGFTFNTTKYLAPYDYASWQSEPRLAAGLPSPLEIPNWEQAHYISFASLVIPNSGKSFMELISVASEIYDRHRQHFFMPAFHMHTPRALVCLLGAGLKGNPFLPLSGQDVDNAESEKLVRDLIVEAAKRGWMAYRAGTPYMDLVANLLDFNDYALPRLYSKLKSVLDPNGILSPGKSGITG
jgi:4-cresol dehydrogenase (hydroxylating) flavoprotein subunit